MKDESEFTQVLFHDDLSQLPVGDSGDGFRVIARGLGKYLECDARTEQVDPRIRTLGESDWRDYRFRAVVTPISFETSNPGGVYCGIVARCVDAENYIALVLDRDECLKLLRRTSAGVELLAFAPLEFCIGQSLSLTLTVKGNDVIGTAGPYTGATTIKAAIDGRSGGKVGFISTTAARFGPHSVECAPEEALRVAAQREERLIALKKKRARFPQMKLERTITLHGLATGANLEFVDLNEDGKLEILAGQSSSSIAEKVSLTKLTCLTALDFNGTILWQAGVPAENGSDAAWPGALPFRFHDLFGDGHPVVVCVFGYDIQIRHAKTGKLMMSAQTPSTRVVSAAFKAVVGEGSKFGDETLNMDVSRIEFCDTQGSGAKKEIIVADAYNLAVLDPLAEPTLDILFKHRGDIRGCMLIEDFNGDGKDEIFAGRSLINHNGSMLRTVPAAGYGPKRIFRNDFTRAICVLESGDKLVVHDVKRLAHAPDLGNNSSELLRISAAHCADIQLGKFRADVTGSQYVTMGSDDVIFFDASFNKISSHRFEALMPMRGNRVLNWTGKPEQLLLLSMESNGGLIDGRGDLVVSVPDGQRHLHCRVLSKYCPDGRDAIAAWNSDELAIYVPAE